MLVVLIALKPVFLLDLAEASVVPDLHFPHTPSPTDRSVLSSLCCFGGVKIYVYRCMEWGNDCEHQEASSYEKAKVCSLNRLVDGTRQTTRYF